MPLILQRMIWPAAIERWRHGQPQQLVELLMSGEPVPPQARVWLAALVAGKAKKNSGAAQLRFRRLDRQTVGDLLRDHRIVGDYEEQLNRLQSEKERLRSQGKELTGGTPSEQAAELVAEKYEISPRAVFDRLKKSKP